MKGTEEANSKLGYFTIVRKSGRKGWDGEITTGTIIKVPLTECLLCPRHCVQHFVCTAAYNTRLCWTILNYHISPFWEAYKMATSCGTTSYEYLHFAEKAIATTRHGVHGFLVNAVSPSLPWTMAMQMLKWAPSCGAKGDITYVWGFALHSKCLININGYHTSCYHRYSKYGVGSSL